MEGPPRWFAEDPPTPPKPRVPPIVRGVLVLNIVVLIFSLYILSGYGEIRFSNDPPFVTLGATYSTPARPDFITLPMNEHRELKRMWNDALATGVEQGRCLSITDGVINEVLPAEISDQTPDSLQFVERCEQASIHTHDNGACRISPRDAIYFFQSKNDFIAVMCGENDFGVYDMEELQKSYQVIIK